MGTEDRAGSPQPLPAASSVMGQGLPIEKQRGVAGPQCPNCHLDQPPGAVECAGCGIIFAKWRPPGERQALALEAEMELERKSGTSPVLLIAAAVVVLMGLFEIFHPKLLQQIESVPSKVDALAPSQK